MTDPAETAAGGMNGLSAAEAAQRLRQFGPNELPPPPRRGWWRIARGVLTEPMFLLLLLAAACYLLLGDLAEGLLLGAFAAITVGLVILQERRSERALEALRALGAPSAMVIRDGQPRRVPSRELVPDDLLLLDEGERVAADGVLLACRGLRVDESLLTGESVPVDKREGRAGDVGPAEAEPGGDQQPFVYSGTLVTQGEGLARVTDTGGRTRAGAIGRSLADIDTEPTRLQRNTGRLVRIFGVFAAATSLALLLFHGLVRQQWIDGLLSAIALAMALLPEEFPLALSVFFAIGGWRLAKVKVLARRSAVIEMLGAATVLCVDKTGTLTENRMRIRVLDTGAERLTLHGSEQDLPESFHRLLEYAVLATRRLTFDPMDRAVGQLANDTLRLTEHLHEHWPLSRQYGLTPELLAMSLAWQADQDVHEVASKGAPEAIADLCHLSPEATATQMQRVSELARDGLRVLAVAAGRHAGAALPGHQHDFDFEWLGLIAFEDPLRDSVPAALAQARAAGIEVKMLTGDYPATARAIAAQAGIGDFAVCTGAELAGMDAATLRHAVATSSVFARIQPEQKLRLVEALKARGEVVAMTGDGVNDAPALKAAHIGIAMGQRGSDVAREAAAMILLDEDFGRILDAVKVGRRVFDNLRKVMLYIVAIHIPIAGMALLPLLLGLPPMLLPAHVVLIEMIIDPMCSIAFENEPAEPDAMRHPPRPVQEALIGPAQMLLGIAQGAVLLLACLAIYGQALAGGSDDTEARTLAFLTLTAGNLALVRSNASRVPALRRLFGRQYLSFWLIAGPAAATVALCLAVPGLRDLFAFSLTTPVETLLAIAVGLAGGTALEWVKWHPAVRRAIGHQAPHTS
jgi:Ca2+-transporting ATPase